MSSGLHQIDKRSDEVEFGEAALLRAEVPSFPV